MYRKGVNWERGKKLKPGKIIPIHTFHPDKYGGLFSRKIVQVSDGEVFGMKGEFILLVFK